MIPTVSGVVLPSRNTILPEVGTSSITHPFKLDAGKDIGQPSVAVITHPAGIKEVIAGGQDDIAHVHCEQFFLLFVVNGLGGTDLFTDFAGAFLKKIAVLCINDRILGHGLGRAGGDGLAIADTCLVALINDLGGAFFHADSAASTEFLVKVTGFLFDGDVKLPT